MGRRIGAVIGAMVVTALVASCRSTTARNELVDLFGRLEGSTTKADVRRSFDTGKYQDLNMREVSGELWIVSTPTEFGATNWVLRLEFSDSQLKACRIRTLDSKEDHPKEAPPDRILPKS